MSNTDSNVSCLILTNDDVVSGKVGNLLEQLNLNITIVTVGTINSFSEYVNKHKVDLFILDIQLKETVIENIILKLRKSNAFRRSTIGTVSNHLLSGTDFKINDNFELANFKDDLNLALFKTQTKIISPETNILILDDDQEIVDIISTFLKGMNHQKFKACKSLAEASALIETNNFDLFLLDWNLGDGTCLDFVEIIKNPEATIIVITARNEVEDIMTLVKHKITNHIIKPFTQNEFEEKLQYAMERSKKK